MIRMHPNQFVSRSTAPVKCVNYLRPPALLYSDLSPPPGPRENPPSPGPAKVFSVN